jgi:hypothetical protein
MQFCLQGNIAQSYAVIVLMVYRVAGAVLFFCVSLTLLYGGPSAAEWLSNGDRMVIESLSGYYRIEIGS